MRPLTAFALATLVVIAMVAASPEQTGDLAVSIESAFPDLFFDQPVFLTHAGGDTLYVVEQRGVIQAMDPGTERVEEYLNITDRVNRGGSEEGLLGLAFAPGFADSGHLFVYYSAASPRRSVIARFTASAGGRPDPSTEMVVLEVEQPFRNHNGGMIAFGPDGMLYIGLGDGGSGGDPQGNGQNRGTLLGSILRIDVGASTTGEPYRVPADNPFVATPGARPEIWAYGLRNPWRFSFDSESGALWLADVGQNAFEEVDVVVRGANYGWNTMEGRHCFERATCDQSGLTLPVAEYTHDFGCSVTGGYEYHGARAPSLEGAYIYADFCSGRVWAVRADRAGPIQIAHEDFRVSSFGVDVDDELYVVSLNGRLFRFAADPDASAPMATPTPPPPPPLAATPTPGVRDDGDAITLWVIGLIVALVVGVLGLVLRMSPLFKNIP